MDKDSSLIMFSYIDDQHALYIANPPFNKLKKLVVKFYNTTQSIVNLKFLH